jgi:glycosyltransferase involved in cell wall biosynthesis
MVMRIGYDITPLSVPRTGVGTYTACLLASLEREGETIVPLSHVPGDDCLRDVSNGSHRRALNKTVWMQVLLRRKLEKQQLDICHFTNNVAPLWSPCPYVLTIHDMTLWLYPSYHPLRRLAAMRPIIPLAARRAAAVITVSDSAKADVVRLLGIAPEKVSVIYEAPEQTFRRPVGESELALARQECQLPDNYLLHVGTLEPRKNLVRLLEAFALLHRRGLIPHHLVFVGQKGWQFEEIFATVDAHALHGLVHFLDYVPGGRLPAIYHLADALVFPSLYEGFGLPVVEAMACGTPVITSPNGSLKEIAGDAAVYLEPESVDSMAETIGRTVADRELLVELGQRGLAHSAGFSWRRAAQQTRHVYRQVLAGVDEERADLGPMPRAGAFSERAESNS